jgi:hypothetical protein
MTPASALSAQSTGRLAGAVMDASIQGQPLQNYIVRSRAHLLYCLEVSIGKSARCRQRSAVVPPSACMQHAVFEGGALDAW